MPPRTIGKPMLVKTVHLPEPYVEFLEDLVKQGFYRSVAEAIREAIRDFIDAWSHTDAFSQDLPVEDEEA